MFDHSAAVEERVKRSRGPQSSSVGSLPVCCRTSSVDPEHKERDGESGLLT